MRAKLTATTLLIGAFTLLAACAASTGGTRSTDRPPVELRAPALDGGVIDVSRYRGSVVVVHIFAPSEPSIAGDVEQLRAIHLGDSDVVVIGVALEAGGYSMVTPWRRAMDVEYLLALVTEPSELHSAHLAALETVPTTLILDARGRMTHRVDRALHRGELAQLLAPLRANISAGRHPPRPG